MTTNTFSAQATTDTTITTTTETVVATLTGVSTGRAMDVVLKGWVQYTTAANTTGLTARIRRGSTVSGTLIDEGNVITIQAVAGSNEELTVHAVDEALDASGVTYVLTLQATAATANLTALQASLTATVER